MLVTEMEKLGDGASWKIKICLLVIQVKFLGKQLNKLERLEDKSLENKADGILSYRSK